MPTEDKIRVVIFKEDDLWVAQCLEYDIGAQASDVETLGRHLTATLQAELAESARRTGKPFGGIEQAPKQYFDMWEKFEANQMVPEKLDGHDLRKALCA